MGGHSAGEVASDLAIRGAYAVVHQAYLAAAVDEDRDDDAHVLQQVVRQAIEEANRYVVREADGAGNDMGATMTMALIAGDRAVIGNIGDSRTYLWRDGQLQRISRDHSLVQRLVELGQITDDEAYAHPQRNAVLRSLGDHATIMVDVFEQRVRPGDGLVLMSDGLWELVRDPAMAALIAGQPDVAAVCDALVAAANAAGGSDNISVVFVTLAATTDEGAEP
jgi:protein phosphatase